MKKLKVIFLVFLSFMLMGCELLGSTSTTENKETLNPKYTNTNAGNKTTLTTKENVTTTIDLSNPTTEYEVSNGVTLKIVESENGYTFFFKGNGEIGAFLRNESEYSYYLDNIDKVIISEGITTIKDGVLNTDKLEYVLLPKSVVSVSSNAFNSNTVIYNNDSKETFACSNKMYSYSENIPSEEDKYFHFVNDEIEVWNIKKVLFIGNSFTWRQEIPTLFKNIALSANIWVEVNQIAYSSQHLYTYADENTDYGKEVHDLLNSRNDFDYVILQEHSTSSVSDYSSFLIGVQNLNKLVKDTQENAEVYLYSTWGYESLSGGVRSYQERIYSAYCKAAATIDAKVTNVGGRFTEVYENYKQYNLYDTDNKHQSYIGGYLSASTHVYNMFGVDIENISFNGSLDNKTARALRMIAMEKDPNIEQTEEVVDLNIAVWGRWITEVRFKELLDDFEDYLKENVVEYKKITYTYYQGATNADSYYSIANYSSQVNNESFDICFPAGENLKDYVTTYIAHSMYEGSIVGPNGTKNDRYVMQITNKDLARMFMFYLTTDSAKTILSK